MVTVTDLKTAQPKVNGSVSLPGLRDRVEIYRDHFGIPHIRAASQRDAFFAQGFATAQDRLWQMEYDRRRGAGRWAEVVGTTALTQDKLMRRFRLEASAQADYRASGPEAREVLEAYAQGVNAFIESTKALPIEYRITGLTPEPWQPWDGLTVFKVRHILMGVFEAKAWRARLVRQLGPERAAALFPGYQPGQLQILPPGSPYAGPLDDGLAELGRGAAALNYLNEVDGGSNSWVLSGDRTASGKPLLAGDSHRALDTPNVYYQNHLACPEFDVVGFSIPGVPGFPHFGHNQWVAWCITHASADYQDLYIERFQEGDPPRYLYQGEWRPAQVYPERIKVRDGQDVDIPVYATHHGPVISGDPAQGVGLAFKYTATDGPKDWPDVLAPMLKVRDCHQLVASMRQWVDPCNNFLFADVHGNIGYLCRGQIPLRPLAEALRSPLNAWLPVPGWTGDHEWQGNIPFEELPQSVNPEQGYFATANNRIVGQDYPYYISLDYAPGFRVERVTRALLSLHKPAAADMAKVHAEQVSLPARAYLKALKKVEPPGALAAQARDRLLAWSGQMDSALVEPTIYSAVRDALLRRVLKHHLGEELAALAWHPADRGRGLFVGRVKTLLVEQIDRDDSALLPPGEDWASMLSRALSEGVAMLQERLGDDMDNWWWRRVHQARPRHTLSAAFPELARVLDPPVISMSGDGDTPLAGSYSPAAFATVTGLSVARYSFDLADWDQCLWAVPLGASGHPGSAHYHDQSEAWRLVQMAPMEYNWDYIAAHRNSSQVLEPE